MTDRHSLIIVEDDLKLREMLTEYFDSKDISVIDLAEGAKASAVILEQQPDIVLLDLMLPGEDGLTICRQIRPMYNGKILMLTASDDDFDHVAALEIGADDFVTKPIKPRVLLARMRMLLRRVDNEPIQTAKTVLEFGALSLNQSRQLCEMNGEAVAMTDSEFDLLWLLASTPDQVLSRVT